MWINRKAYEQWVGQVRTLQAFTEGIAASTQAQLAEKDAEITRLRDRLDAREARHTESLRSAAAAKAYSDIWRVRVTELTIERAELLAKLVPGLNLAVPHIQQDPVVMPPGIDFEDMGDAAAAMSSYADSHPVEGMTSRRVDDLVERVDNPGS